MAVEKQEPQTEDILEEEVEVDSMPGGEEVDVAVEGEENYARIEKNHHIC